MKRKIFAVFTILSALLLASCSDVNIIETEVESPYEQNSEADNSNEAYITISVKQDGKRTALPVTPNMNEFTSFNLNGRIRVTDFDKTWTSTQSESAYSQMINDTIAVKEDETYTFTLTAILDGITYQGTLRQDIIKGENHLSFELVLKELSESSEYNVGLLWIELSFPSVVREFDAELTNLDGTPVTPIDTITINGQQIEQFIETRISGTRGAYQAFPINVGNYIVNFTFYGDTEKTLKLGQWREYAGIAGGFVSHSEINIESEDELESLYSINLNTNSGTISGNFPGSYTRYSSEITLPGEDEISRTGYCFEGWYDAETGGNRVYTIPAGSVGNKTFYARWSLVNYTITLDYNNRYGTFEIPATATYGTPVSFSFSANTGCRFNSISSDDVILEGSGTHRSFTMPANNITISADFSRTHLGTKDRPDALWDIVFNDGSAIPYSSSLTFTQAQKEAAIAILVCYDDCRDGMLGLGLKHNSLSFCASTATLYVRRDDLSPHDGLYNTYMVTQTDDYSETNYPAVWWAKHYEGNGNIGHVAGDINGGYDYNWFLPSVEQLEKLYEQKGLISEIISKLGSTYADPIENPNFMTSTQADLSSDTSIYLIDFANGNRIHWRKDLTTNVLVIRFFSTAN